MAADDPQTRIRFPPDLKEKLEALARMNHRSFNAEVVARLEHALAKPPLVEAPTAEAVDAIVSFLETPEGRNALAVAMQQELLKRNRLAHGVEDVSHPAKKP